MNRRKLTHYSRQKGLKVLSPTFMGTGAPSQELKQGPVQTRQTSYYTEGVEPESVVRGGAVSKYTVNLDPSHRLYDIYEDPEGHVSRSVKETGKIDTDHIRGTLKDAGYTGFYTTHPEYSKQGVVNIFHDMPVSGEEEIGKSELEKGLDDTNNPNNQKLLYHGTPTKIYDKIKTEGFKLTSGKRSGAFGAITETPNHGIFLTDTPAVAHFFGQNRTGHEGGYTYGVHKVSTNLGNNLDLTQKWPSTLKNIGVNLKQKYDGSRTIKRDDVYWLLDKPEFVNHIKSLGYHSVKFHESKSLETVHKLPPSNTYMVFDPERLAISTRINKTDELEKGAKGDWQKEGYKLSHSYNPDFDQHRIRATSPSGQEAGSFIFERGPEGYMATSSMVHPEHRRKGIASAAYGMLEAKVRGPLSPHTGRSGENKQSEDAQALWNQPNRPFGKSDELEKGLKGDWQKEGYRLEHWQDKDGFHNVAAMSPNNRQVGYASFTYDWIPNEEETGLVAGDLKGWDVHVHPEHQRKGLASAMYSLAEQKSGKKIMQGGTTDDGTALWNQPNRPFGKNELKKEFFMLKEEPLMKPYHSEAQRRWAHTEAGTKALGGKEAVKEWDRSSKGLDLPEKMAKSLTQGFFRSNLKTSKKDTV